MRSPRILIVDDEEDILELVSFNLEKEGLTVDIASTGEDALNKARVYQYDLIVLDLMLPGVNGLDVCRSLKSDPKTNSIPIFMLTAKGEESDIVAGLELGADDYLTKPFSPRVLVARIRAMLRRSRPTPRREEMIRIHDLTVNKAKYEVSIGGDPIDLTATEFRILSLLASRPGWVLTRNQIVEGVHGDDYPVTDRSVDVQIVGLRKKLGNHGTYIETVRGIGYRFKE